MRGRPRWQPTPLRSAVERYILERAADGEVPTSGQIMRACGLHDRASARRIIRDLREMRRLPDAPTPLGVAPVPPDQDYPTP